MEKMNRPFIDSDLLYTNVLVSFKTVINKYSNVMVPDLQ